MAVNQHEIRERLLRTWGADQIRPETLVLIAETLRSVDTTLQLAATVLARTMPWNDRGDIEANEQVWLRFLRELLPTS